MGSSHKAMQFVPKYWQDMRKWLEGPLGKHLLQLELKQLQQILPKLFGYHLLLLGEPNFASCINISPINHKVMIHPVFCEDTEIPFLCSRQDKLPIMSDQIDVIYIPYCLEYLLNPYEVLAEVYRALRPEGYAIISCFNPWSIWGCWRIGARFFRQSPWKGKFISIFKMKEWINQLDFEITWVKNFNFSMPFEYRGFIPKFSLIEKFGQKVDIPWGNCYIIVVSKKITPLTPIRPQWSSTKQRIVAGDLAEPSTRG